MYKLLSKSLNLNKIGWIELIIALYPILTGYEYGSFKLAIFIPLILNAIIIIKYKVHLLPFRPLVWFTIFTIAHEVLWLFVLPSIPSHFINSLIGFTIFLSSIFIITPVINQEKLEGAINWVAIICIGGLLYHVFLSQTGSDISPIKLPFMPEMSSDMRLYEIGVRPCSFFWEPQSYVSFMLVPMFYALNRKNYIWALIIALSIIASTSTTGIVLTVIMLSSYLFTQKVKLINKILIVISLLGVGYFLLNSQYAEAGLNKMENTNLEETARTINGPLIALNMSSSEWSFGIPYANATDYYYEEYPSSDILIANDEEGSVFVSGFWYILIRFGIIGLFLFVNLYWKIIRLSREIIPYACCLFIALFSNPDSVGSSFLSQFIIMLSFVYYQNKINNEKSLHPYNTVCK